MSKIQIRSWTWTSQGIRKCRGSENSRQIPVLSTLAYKALSNQGYIRKQKQELADNGKYAGDDR